MKTIAQKQPMVPCWFFMRTAGSLSFWNNWTPRVFNSDFTSTSMPWWMDGWRMAMRWPIFSLSLFFFGGANFTFFNLKNMISTHTKDFCEKMILSKWRFVIMVVKQIRKVVQSIVGTHFLGDFLMLLKVT